jgi:hypothetical protein
LSIEHSDEAGLSDIIRLEPVAGEVQSPD